MSGIQAPRKSSTPNPPAVAPNNPSGAPGTPKATQVSAAELSTTAEGQRLLNNEANSTLASQRHGRGPRQGEILHGSSATGQITMAGDEARRTGTIKLLERWKADMPTEGEMLPRDKYSMFDRKAKGYRKGVHKLPKWTRVSQRLNPPGF